MSWKIICAQQDPMDLEVTIDENGLTASVNSKIQDQVCEVTWKNINLPFDKNL